MKIGILTQPLGHNYGGLLQNWALQTFLKKQGHDPVTINLRKLDTGRAVGCTAVARQLAIYFMSGCRRNLFRKDASRFDPKYLSLREFMTENLRVSAPVNPPLYGAEPELSNLDAIIVGSDQVWRVSYSPNILNYFCDFIGAGECRSKKIAYAASFGSSEDEYTDELREHCSQLLKRFDAVSIREKSGVQTCLTMFGAEAQHVADPVLLLSSDEYLGLVRSNGEGSRVGAYLLDSNLKKLSLVRAVATYLDVEFCPLIPIATDDSAISRLKAANRPYCGPEVWLARIRNSKCMVTDSFHGVCFSIIFHRPFVVIGNRRRGLDRFHSILGMLGLESRLVDEDVYTGIVEQIVSTEIDWADVDRRLDAFRVESIAFLEEALS